MEHALPGDLAPKRYNAHRSSQPLGLGVEQNGVLGCRYHHSLLDNGNKGLHREMDSMLQDYMRELFTLMDAGQRYLS